MALIATDLDRTLIPNGKEDYDGSLGLFKEIIDKEKFKLVYVTGRDLGLVRKAIREYGLPVPDYIVTNVGGRIYSRGKFGFRVDRDWFRRIEKGDSFWDVKGVGRMLNGVDGLRLQERRGQDRFKVSYYVDSSRERKVLKEVRAKLKGLKLKIIFSLDYPEKRGLLDILPGSVSKLGALDYLVSKLGAKRSEVLCSGDSGNDLEILASGYRSVVVANASVDIKRKVGKLKKNKRLLYIARKRGRLNGNYVSGILQGLVYFGFVRKLENN